jgi:hypothetical protein
VSKNLAVLRGIALSPEDRMDVTKAICGLILEPTLGEKRPAGRQIIQNAAGIARIALLFDGDIAAIAEFRQKAADGRIID